MCYSAMVEQDAKKMGLRFKARIQRDIYQDLFMRRLSGEKLYINKGMEASFLKSKDKEDLEIAQNIKKWHDEEVTRIEAELFKQKKRLNDAERSIKSGKVTKKAETDVRVATDKIEKAKRDLERHKSSTLSDSDSRIYPFHYVTTLALDEKGNKIVLPMRYHMRPHDKDESFDREYNGCYNARYDNLSRVAWWKDAFGKRHGIIVVRRFFENVDPTVYAKKNKLAKEDKEKSNLVLCFEPENGQEMIIPVIWDVWKKKGQANLISAALITDEPAPEIAAAGHDRTPIFLKESVVDAWLNASGDAKDIKEILMERERPFYSHRVVGAA